MADIGKSIQHLRLEGAVPSIGSGGAADGIAQVGPAHLCVTQDLHALYFPGGRLY